MNEEEKKAPVEKPINETLAAEMDALLKSDEVPTEPTVTPKEPEPQPEPQPQPEPTPAPQPEPKTAPKSKKWLLPTIIGTVVIIASVAGFFIYNQLQSQQKPTPQTPSQSQQVPETPNDSTRSSFTSLTKEDSIAYLTKVQKNKDLILENLVKDDKNVRLGEKATSFTLLFSYSDPSEILAIAKDRYSFFNYKNKNEADFDIITNDYYSVVVPKNLNTCSGSLCPKGIAFNKKYLDYYEKTTGNSTNHYTELKSSDFETFKKIFPVFFATTSNWSSNYSYDFVSESDKYSFIAYNISVGLDLSAPYNSGDEPPYQINLYLLQYDIDLKTGTITTKRNKSNTGFLEVLKSFKITTDEAKGISDLL